jgi:WD40 repeat protein
MERRYQYLPQITFQLHAPLSALEFSLDGQFLAAGINRLLRIWDLDSKDLPTSYLEYYAHEEAFVTTLLWTGVGLFSAYSSGEIALLSFHEDGEGGRVWLDS